MAKLKNDGIERRKFIRLSTVFPVSYQIIASKDRKELAEVNQAFTRDVSQGGMCLEVTNLKDELARKLEKGEAKLSLVIEVPFSTKPIGAFGKVAWIQKIKESYPNKYLLGIAYELISEKERKKIVGYARALIWRPRLIAIAFLTLVITVSFATYRGLQEQKARQMAQQRIVSLQQERLLLEKRLEEVDQTKQTIEEQLDKVRNERLTLERRVSELSKTEISKKQLEELKSQIEKSQKIITSLQSELEKASKEKEQLAKDVMKLKGQIPTEAIVVILASGRSLKGILLDENANFLKVKLSTGTVTFKKNEVVEVRRLPRVEAVKVEREIEEAELKREEEEEKRRKFIEEQKAKGLVFYQGNWVKQEEIVEIEKGKKAVVKEGRKIEEIISNKEGRPKITVDEENILVNGKPFFIKGIAYGISYPGYPEGTAGFEQIPFEVFEKDFKMMKEAGINTIRTYEPLPDKLLDLAEKYGLFVIETVVYPTGYTDYTHAGQLITLKETAINNVLKHKDRPSILMWSIWNDAPFEWGAAGNIVKRYGKRQVNDFLKEIYDAVKTVDKRHPVTAANILKVKGYDVGFDFLDVIGVNAYIGGHGYSWRGKKAAETNVREILELSKKYKKPVFITETGFSTFIKKDTQNNALKIQLEALDRKTAGVVIFEWADEWWKAGNPDTQDEHIEEHWGILTAERKVKPGFNVIKEYFNKIPSFLE
jgi:exo-beta-1,3-glucanase (GH17 family)